MRRPVLLSIAILAVAGVAVSVGLGALRPQDNLTLFGSLLATLVVVSAIIERALDLFLSLRHGKEGDETATRVAQSRKQLEAAQTANAKALAAGQPTMDLQPLQKALKEAQDLRKTSRAKTRDLATVGGVLMGVVISAIGFRALATLVVLSDTASTAQRTAFDFFDIVFTGAVLAGGSDGLHKLMEVYRQVTEEKAGNR